MQIQGVQRPSEIDQLLTIQAQRVDRGADSRSQPDHQGRVFIPGEVIPPAMAAWIEQSQPSAGLRINLLNFISLVVITSGAGPRQIARFCLAAARDWNDMFDVVRFRRKAPEG